MAKTKAARFADAIIKGFEEHPNIPICRNFYAQHNDKDQVIEVCLIGGAMLGCGWDTNERISMWSIWEFLRKYGFNPDALYVYKGTKKKFEDIIFDLNDILKLDYKEAASVIRGLKTR